MRKLSTEQNATGTWAASSTISTAIEDIGLVTELNLTARVTPSATLTGANQPDGLNRVVQNFTIRGGSHTYVTLPAEAGAHGGTILHYMNRWDGLGLGHSDGGITAPNRTTQNITFTVHPGSRPFLYPGVRNEYDLSAFIPAGAETQLNAEWLTGANSLMDDSVTISSATAVYSIHRVQGTAGEIRQEMQNQGVVLPVGPWTGMIPAWSAKLRAHSATTSDFNTEFDDIVTGAFLKRAIILAQDATGTRPLRADDEITKIQVYSPKTSEVLFELSTDLITNKLEAGDQLTANSGASESAGTEKFGVDFNQAAPRGIYPVDFRPRTFVGPGNRQPYQVGINYGWDLRTGIQNGDLRIGYLIGTQASGDDRLVLWERLMPTNVSLDVANR